MLKFTKCCLSIVLFVFGHSTTAYTHEGLHNDALEKAFIGEAVFINQTQIPKLDGRLNDPIWHTLPVLRNFVQRDPNFGQPATEDTEVRFCYDTENLYVGVRCFDSQPDRIIKRLGYRERDMYGSDTFAMFIDSRHDHRTGVKFGTNALGMREDSSRYNDYLRDNSWDGVWWVKTSVDSLGWIAEFRIPFKNFRFVEQDEQIWGLNFQRDVRRLNETTFWKPISRDDGSINRMSKLGHLKGIRKINTGRRFEFVPFATQGLTQQLNTNVSSETELGLDAKYAITPNLTLDTTLNPDFAQVEADVDEINLTRFPTRFAEQRPFFVEGNNAFLLPLELFFSRRIGSRGDILWGTKVTGKAGPYTVGLLASQTGDWNYLGIQDKDPTKEEATFGVMRLKRDVLGKSNVGFLFGDKEIGGSYSRVLGFDFSLRPGDIYFINGQIASAWNKGLSSDNKAYFIDLSRQTDLFSARFFTRRLDPNFEINEIGFLRKEKFRGEQLSKLTWTYSPRPKHWNLRQTFFTGWIDAQKPLPTNQYLTDQTAQDPNLIIDPTFINPKTGFGGGANVALRFQGGSSLSLFASRQKRYDLTGPFYADSLGAQVRSASYRPVSVGITGFADNFYNFNKRHVSREYAISIDGTFKTERMTVETRLRHSQIFDPQDNNEGRFWLSSIRGIYLFNPDLFFRAFFQARINDTSGSQKETYLISSVFAWEFRRGSRLFVAYNESRDDHTGRFELINQALIFKIAHQIDL